MKRTTRGYILIDAKKHFVYEGINIIGRHKGATVIIPNTSVSHYHSTIVIIEDRHYVSDISSCNGTYLEECKLIPLQLYEVNAENVLKFGLVDATYFKLANSTDVIFENKRDNVEFKEDIFIVDTQVYDIPVPTHSKNSLEECNRTTKLTTINKDDVSKSVTISINDMPTQIMESCSDDELELVTSHAYGSINLDKSTANQTTPNRDIPINDLPTQIVTRTEDDLENADNPNEKCKIGCVSIGDLLIHDLPTQLSSPVKADDTTLAETSNIQETSSDIIEETIVEKDKDQDDESSRESTDFLTMQPCTQNFTSESESQLCVQQLRRRVRNIIGSSDEDSSHSDPKNTEKLQWQSLSKISSQINMSSDDDTDIEFSPIKTVKKKNKTVINSDSDGDSTDVEATDNTVTKTMIPSITMNDANKDDLNIEAGLSTNCESTADKNNGNEQNNLDDSDVIPTTQDIRIPDSVSNLNNDENEKQQKTETSENVNFEASLADSFRLVLTNTPANDDSQLQKDDKCDADESSLHDTPIDSAIINNSKDVPVDKSKAINTNNDIQSSSTSARPENQTDKCLNTNNEINEEEHTQLEVQFDDVIPPVESSNGRPANPLVNVLEAVENPEKDESVEDKLAKMFESQVESATSNEDLFAQPTQMVTPSEIVSLRNDNDTFLIPTQKIGSETYLKKKTSTCEDTTDVSEKNQNEITSKKGTVGNDDDIFLIPTQKMGSETFFKKQSATCEDTTDVSEKNQSEITPKEGIVGNDDDIFLVPTQQMVSEIPFKKRASTSKEATDVSKQNKSEINPEENIMINDDDIFLIPTQKVVSETPLRKRTLKHVEATDISKKDKGEITPDEGIVSNDEDDVFLQPTQNVTSECPEIASEKTVQSKEIMDSNKEANDEDDIFLQPTQAAFDFEDAYTTSCDYYSSVPIESKTNTDSTAPLVVETAKIADIFSQPTQLINNNISKKEPQASTSSHREDNDPTNLTIVTDTVARLVDIVEPISGDESKSSSTSSALQQQNSSKTKESILKSSVGDKNVENLLDDDGIAQTDSKMVLERKSTSAKSSHSDEVEVECKNSDNLDKATGTDTIKEMPKLIEKEPEKDIATKQKNVGINNSNNKHEIVTKKHTRKSATTNNQTPEKYTKLDVTSSKLDKIGEGKIVVKSVRISARMKNKKDAAMDVDSDNTNLEKSKVMLINKKMDKSIVNQNNPEILVQNQSCSSANAILLNTKEEIVLKDSEDLLKEAQKSVSRSGKSKHHEEPEQPKMAKKAKLEKDEVKNSESSNKRNSPLHENKPLRRSTRKKSTEEKSEVDDDKTSTKLVSPERKLCVINEINTPPKHDKRSNSHTSVDSGDEFVDAQEATPSKTPNRTRRPVLNKNQKKNEALSVTKLITESVVTTRSRRSKKNETKSDSNLDEPKQTEQSGLERRENQSDFASPSTSKTKNNVDNNAKKQIRKHNEVELSGTEDEASGTSAGVATTRSRKSKKQKTEKKTPEQQQNIENELACSSSSTTTSSSVDSQTRKSRRRRSLSKTSEDDFQVNNTRKEVRPSVTVPCTPERIKRVLKPKVIFTMLDSPELETIIRSLGGFVVDSVEASTVLITSSVKRSQKLLSAIGLAKPICSPKWLHGSKKANKFLDPWDYILEDDEAETKWNFSLRESLKRSANEKLLQNYTFQLMVNTAQDVLRGSIESCGGKCVSRAPSKDNQSNFVIVASPENKSKYARFLKQNPAPRIIAAEAIFDGVLRQELHFEHHLLK